MRVYRPKARALRFSGIRRLSLAVLSAFAVILPQTAQATIDLSGLPSYIYWKPDTDVLYSTWDFTSAYDVHRVLVMKGQCIDAGFCNPGIDYYAQFAETLYKDPNPIGVNLIPAPNNGPPGGITNLVNTVTNATNNLASFFNSLLNGGPSTGPTINNGFIQRQRAAVTGTRGSLGFSLVEQSPDYFGGLYQGTSLSTADAKFNFVATDIGDGDWIDLAFNGNVLWSSLGQQLTTGQLYEGSFDPSLVSGQTGVLMFNLHSVGNTNARFAIVTSGNDIVSAVPEPATWAMMLLGFGAIGAAMRRTRRRGVIQQVA